MKMKLLAILLLVVSFFPPASILASAQTPPVQPGPGDGWIAFIGKDNNVWLVQPDGSDLRHVTNDASTMVRYEQPRWSPDGANLALLRYAQNNDYFPPGLYLMQLSTFEIEKVVEKTSGGVDWLANSQRILYDISPVYGTPTEEHMAFCRGKIQQYDGLYFYDLRTKQSQVAIPKDETPLFVTQLSPDNQQIIIRTDEFATQYGAGPFFVTTLDGEGSFYPLEKSYSTCHWSTDGAQIACDTWDPNTCGNGMEGTCPITLYTPAGKAIKKLVLSSEPNVNDLNPTWSPDGRFLAVNATDGFFYADGPCGGGSGPSLYAQHTYVDLISLPDYSRRRLASGIFEGWSPDGNYVLVTQRSVEKSGSTQTYQNWIYAVSAQTGETGKPIAEGSNAVWQPVTRPAPITDLVAGPGEKAGQVRLDWTMPETVHSRDQITALEIRYSQQPITENNWDSVTGRERVPVPEPARKPGQRVNHTLETALDLHKQWYLAIKTVSAENRYSAISNSPWLIDTGFRPVLNGYAFCNGPSDRKCNMQWNPYPTPPADKDFTIDDLRRMVGDAYVCESSANGECHPYSYVETWLIWANKKANGGHCYGMDATAQLFYLGGEALVSPLNPGAKTTIDLSLQDARREISYQFFYQFFNPIWSEETNEKLQKKDASEIIASLNQLLLVEKPEPVMLVLMIDSGGHSLTPFAVEKHSEDEVWVHVYDSNCGGPHNELCDAKTERVLKVNLKERSWNYYMSPDLGTWGSTVSKDPKQHLFYLGLVPYALHKGQLQPRWGDQYNSDFMLVGDAHLLISDAQGNMVGYKDGQYVNTIPGAAIHPNMDSSGATGPDYSLPQPGAYTIQLTGNSPDGTGNASVAQFGAGYAATVEDIPVTPRTKDMLMIAPDGTKIIYRSSEEKTATIAMALDGPESSHQFKVSGIPLSATGLVSMQANLAGGQIILSNEQDAGGTYQLQITANTPEGKQTVTYPDITLSARSTHAFDFANWKPASNLKLSVDKNGDGKYETVNRLAPDNKKVAGPRIITIAIALGCAVSLLGLGLMAFSLIRGRARA